MTQPDQHNAYEWIMEHLIANGPDALRQIATVLFNEAMKIEREQFIGVPAHQHSSTRKGHANGYKSKQLHTRVGTLDLQVPKTRNHTDTPFYPGCLEQGRRSERALLCVLSEMYLQGVSTRRVESVLNQLGIRQCSSTQVSRATALLDESLKAWRERELANVPYLILDARYEKVRMNHQVVDAAVLSAVGILETGHRSVLGVNIATSEAEINWREFLSSLVDRKLKGVRFIVSDDHAGLKAARKSVFPAVPWQRCQFHLSQNAIHHAPKLEIRQRIGRELRSVWNAPDRDQAQFQLDQLVEKYQGYPQLANWLSENVPQGFSVFGLPDTHRRKLRTTNGIERPIQQEIKRRTRLVRVFPNEAALLRMVSAILIEIDEDWTNSDKRYIVWNNDDDSTINSKLQT